MGVERLDQNENWINLLFINAICSVCVPFMAVVYCISKMNKAFDWLKANASPIVFGPDEE